MRRKGFIRSNSSSTESSTNHSTVSSASSSRLSRLIHGGNHRHQLSTDLQLGLGNSFSAHHHQVQEDNEESGERSTAPTLFVKVYMEGIAIGRKLDLLAHDGFHDLIRTLEFMFKTTIIWAEGEELQPENCHVLTYEDREGDWMIVGDVPWEVFLTTVKRLKITRIG